MDFATTSTFHKNCFVYCKAPIHYCTSQLRLLSTRIAVELSQKPVCCCSPELRTAYFSRIIALVPLLQRRLVLPSSETFAYLSTRITFVFCQDSMYYCSRLPRPTFLNNCLRLLQKQLFTVLIASFITRKLSITIVSKSTRE